MCKSPANLASVLTLSISAIAAALLLLPQTGYDNSWISIAGLIIGTIFLLIAFSRKYYPLAHLCLFFLLLFGWKISPLWPAYVPAGLLFPFVSYLIIVLLLPQLRKSLSWFSWGRPGRSALLAALLILALSLLVLYIWALWSENVIEHYVYLFHPEILYIELIIFAFLFATINAICQEIIFRGVLQDALKSAVAKDSAAILLQAVLFGLIHIEGIPSGLTGVVMAFLYGSALGMLKRMSGGLLLPVAVHFIADLFIFFLVFYKAWVVGLFDLFPRL